MKSAKETGIGYQVAAVELKDGRWFDQVEVSEGCIIEVRGQKEIPFATDQVSSVTINHRRWNFRDWSDRRVRVKSAAG